MSNKTTETVAEQNRRESETALRIVKAIEEHVASGGNFFVCPGPFTRSPGVHIQNGRGKSGTGPTLAEAFDALSET